MYTLWLKITQEILCLPPKAGKYGEFNQCWKPHYLNGKVNVSPTKVVYEFYVGESHTFGRVSIT